MSPTADLRDRPTGVHQLVAAVIDLRHQPASIALSPLRAPARGTRRSAVDPVPDHLAAVAVEGLDDAARLVDRWLTRAEQATADGRGERGRAAHIAGRVAAKHAVIAHLEARGFAAVGPERIEITNDGRGCPVVRVRGARVAARHLRVSIAHTGSAAAAVATCRPARDAEPAIGIDVEAIEPRSSRFEQLTLTAAERDLAPIPDDDRDTWLTRLWSAKEAAAKATGRGLEGRPKAFEAVAVEGERIRIGARWIRTEVTAIGGGRQIVAVTADHRTECTWHRS